MESSWDTYLHLSYNIWLISEVIMPKWSCELKDNQMSIVAREHALVPTQANLGHTI